MKYSKLVNPITFVLVIVSLMVPYVVEASQTAAQRHADIVTFFGNLNRTETFYGLGIHGRLKELGSLSGVEQLGSTAFDFYVAEANTSSNSAYIRMLCTELIAIIDDQDQESELLLLLSEEDDVVVYEACRGLFRLSNYTQAITVAMDCGWYRLLVQENVPGTQALLANVVLTGNVVRQFTAAFASDLLNQQGIQYSYASNLLKTDTAPSGMKEGEFRRAQVNAIYSLWRRSTETDMTDIGDALLLSNESPRSIAMLALGNRSLRGSTAATTELQAGLQSSFEDVVVGCTSWLNPKSARTAH